MKDYLNEVKEVLTKFTDTQDEVLDLATKEIVQRIQNGGTFYVFGTGHSHMVGEEFYARAGGLACIQLIAPMELTLGETPVKSTYIERIADYAYVIMAQYQISENDIVLISSNSGRNPMIVEMALQCKQIGAATIAFTNLTHSSQVTSRHDSKKRLFEICDYVIDNCGVIGDAMIQLDGVRGKMGSSSSIVGMYMAQTLSMKIAAEMVKCNVEPPVFLSANIDAGDDWNASIMKKYYNV